MTRIAAVLALLALYARPAIALQAQWQMMPDPSNGGKLHTLVACGHTILLGGVGHVWRSDDDAMTWSEIGAGQLPAQNVLAIGTSPFGDIVIGTAKSGTLYPAAYRWTGTKWRKATGLPGNLTMKISAFAQAYGSLFLATAYQGDVWRSNDGGDSYTLYATNAQIRTPGSVTGALWTLQNLNGVLAASGELTNGVFIDPLNGGQWGCIGPFDADGYSANEKQWCVNSQGILYAGRKHISGQYISRSLNPGAWELASNGVPTWQVVTAICEDDQGNMWTAVQTTAGVGHILHTADGLNWSDCSNGVSGICAASITPGADWVYMLGTLGGIYRMPSGG